MLRSWRLRATLVLPVSLLALVVAAPAAHADPAAAFGCRAAPLSANLLGLDLGLGALGANAAFSPCAGTTTSGTSGLPLGVSAVALQAATTLDDPSGAVRDQTAHAGASVTDLGVAPAGFPGLLTVGAATSAAQVRCVSGAPVYTGSSTVAGVKVLGQTVPVGSSPSTTTVLGLTVSLIPDEVLVTASGQTRAALHVLISSGLTGSILDVTVAPSTVGVTGDVCAASALPATTVTVTTPAPTVTLPAITVPSPTVTLPAVTVPGTTVTVPGATVTVPTPPVTVPAVTVTVPAPTVTLPAVTVPSPTVTLPAVTVPSPTVTLPAVTVPGLPVTVPAVTVTVPAPPITTPALTVTVPAVTLPSPPAQTVTVTTPATTVTAPGSTVTVTAPPATATAPPSTLSTPAQPTTTPGGAVTAPTPAPAATTTTSTPGRTVTVAAPAVTTTTTTPGGGTSLLGAGTPDDDTATTTTTTTVPSSTTLTTLTAPLSVLTPGAPLLFSSGSESQLVLGCVAQRLALTDVQLHGNGVALRGAADRSLIGQTVRITYVPTGRVVATTKVGLDALFAVRAAAPATAAERAWSRARYRASIGGLASHDLKLARRTAITKVSANPGVGGLRVSGRVRAPLASDAQVVRVQRRTSCTTWATLGTATLRADGSFSATVPLPAGASAALLRAGTKVPTRAGAAAGNLTFSVPRSVRLR